ncbi:hypothetical protein ANCDUO_14183 [Ancylostoma duodenale]|uniref:Uncharacterized protein n=1 Tax=Ancylostoma duodenale TaxID=51022 RepID=A0A0C2G9T0_9BILA|nr:hypothetical protein ANCDUO_14183 [Ancylostoma duodenale]
MAPDVEKFEGPTFSSLMDISSRKEHSLVRKVTVCSPGELGALVIGNAVYEVFMDLPECSVLNGAMASVKRKQARLPAGRALRWMNQNLSIKQEEDKSQLMESQDMRLFLSRCPINVLSNAVFKPFLPIVRKFLLNKLFQFTNKKRLYEHLPEFPSEKQLRKFFAVFILRIPEGMLKLSRATSAAVVNAIGPMEQLVKNYPHLARMKHEMIFNIMDFTIKYCLDWIWCNSEGIVEYYCPPLEQNLQKQESCPEKKSNQAKKSRKSSVRKGEKVQSKAESDDSGWETQTMTNSSSSSSSNLEELKNEPLKKLAKIEVIELKEEEEEEEGTAELPTVSSSSDAVVPLQKEREASQSAPQQAPLKDPVVPDVQASVPVPSYPMIHDDWSDMLTMALTDPSLAPHYKTMIHCLVASNRDMKNMIMMMRTQPS